ncbi:YaaA family protein [Glutamicibacter uratoxydans]|uniref:YaaA family protein n=1 Tax=Glutamicibacter uratoxydans TaxID=43667 RepID=UPI003D6E8E9A
MLNLTLPQGELRHFAPDASAKLEVVFILLPPSEGKTAHATGDPFELAELSFPELSGARSEVLDALAEVSARPDAMEVLGVGASLANEVARNIALHTEPAARAHDIYSGVLFEALGYQNLDAASQARADDAILVVSALWGAVSFADRIPPYRLSMNAKLAELGKLASWWKKRLTPVLDELIGDQLVVDARSSTYAAAYKPSNGNAVAVNVYQLRGGVPKVVSHFAKHTRGEVARFLVQQDQAPTSIEQLLKLTESRWDAHLTEDKKGVALNIALAEDHQFTTAKVG